MPRPLGLAATTCLAVSVVACSGGTAPTAQPTALSAPTASLAVEPTGSPNGSPATSPTEAPIPTAIPTVLPTSTPAPTLPTGTFSLSANVWWSGFDITVTGGDYDVAKHTLTIDASFTNAGTQESELRQLSDGTSVTWNGQSLPGFETAGIVAGGATGTGQIGIKVPAGFDPSQAVLTFGKPGQHQAFVPLNSAEATSDRVQQLPMAGKVTMGKYVTYTITSAYLVPGSCSGYPARIKYGPQDASLVSIVVFGTAKSTDSTNYRQIDRGYLVLPDGSKLDSNPAMGLSLALKGVLTNVAMCFAVTPPFDGTYTLKMHEYRSNATGSFVLQLQ